MRLLALAPEYRSMEFAMAGEAALADQAGGLVSVISLVGHLEGRTPQLAEFRTAVSAAAADPEVDGILIPVKSPGGAWAEIPEAAEAVRRARGSKPVLAHVSTVGASAAYMIAAQATEVTASPSARVGGVGVIVERQGLSDALEREGIEYTIARRPERKAEFHRALALDEEARNRIEAEADMLFDQALGLVARGRGWSEGETRERIARGRLLSSEEALGQGLIDAVETLENAFSRLMRTALMRRRTR